MFAFILSIIKSKVIGYVRKHPKGFFILAAVGLSMGILIPVLIGTVAKTVVQTVYNTIVDFFTRRDDMTEYSSGYIEANYDPEQYDIEAAKAWADSDPDMTTIMYSTMKEARPVVMADDYDWKNEEDPNKKLWYEILRDDNVYIDDSNIESILQQDIDYNMRMFEKENVHYEYFGYIHDYVGPTFDEEGTQTADGYWHWATDEPATTTDDDERWGIATREKIEGEEDEDGIKKFQIHWGDVMAYAMYFGYQNIEEYKNNKEDSPYRPEEGEYEVNDTAKYFMKDEEVDYIFDLFRYTFDYANEPDKEQGYDVVGGLTPSAEDGKDHNTESTIYNWDESFEEPRKLMEGNYTVGYRYEREGIEPEGYEPQTHYATEEEMESPPVYTWMTPEASLLTINNSYDHYVYQYIDTDEVPDYTPDPENYEPPKGKYCVGRWHYIDPYEFIMAMAKMCPEYRDRYYTQKDKKGKAGETYLDKYNGGYEWSYEMIDDYCSYLEMWEEGGLGNRSEFFFELEELYREIRDTGEIHVEYEGVDVDPEQLESMKKEIAESIMLVDPYVEKVIFPDDSFAYKDGDGDLHATPGSRDTMETDDPAYNIPEIGESDTSKGAIPYSQADLDAMIRTVCGEAGNQGIEGMKTVAEVIYNRVISDRFKQNTVQGICTAPGQFDGYKTFKDTPISKLKKMYPGCEEACKAILAGGKSVLNNTNIIGFKSDKNTTGWNKWGNYNKDGKKIYGHYFYYLPDGKNNPSVDNAKASTSYKNGNTTEVESGGGATVVGGSNMPHSYKVISWDEEKELRYSHDPDAFPFASLGVTFRQGYMYNPEGDAGNPWPEDPGGYEHPEYEDFEIPDDAMLLDMFEYINQADPRWASLLRGDSNETIQHGGCLDCSTAMIVAYYLRRHVDVAREISKFVPKSEQLDQPSALAQYGMRRGDNIHSNFKQGVINEIKAKRPCILHIRGRWVSKEDGRVLHKNTGGHFLVAVGYDSKGIYVYDPGRRANKHISWDDWDNVGDRYYRPIYKD